MNALVNALVAELGRVPLWALVALANAAAVILFAAYWIRELQPDFDPDGEPTGLRWVVGRIFHASVIVALLAVTLVCGAVIVALILGAEVGGATVARFRRDRRIRALRGARP